MQILHVWENHCRTHGQHLSEEEATEKYTKALQAAKRCVEVHRGPP